MSDRLAAVVERCAPREGTAWLAVGRSRLVSRLWPGLRAGAAVEIRILPEEVILCAGHPGRTSARNVLPGHVTGLRQTPLGVFVTTDVGFPLLALVTRRSAADLGLHRRTAVFALVKATAIRPAEGAGVGDAAGSTGTGTGGFRVSLRGAHGYLDPPQIDFLRALARTGSLAAAARDLGLAYRTAWMRARAIGRAWGQAVIARRAGGPGGGGSGLTPVGMAILERAARLESGRPG